MAGDGWTTFTLSYPSDNEIIILDDRVETSPIVGSLEVTCSSIGKSNATAKADDGGKHGGTYPHDFIDDGMK